MAENDRTDQELERFFAAARGQAPDPSPGLLARVLEDAQAVQAAQQADRSAPAPRRPRWRQAVDLLGGWPAMAGLATAGVAGLWLGLNPPAALTVLPLAGFGASDTVLLDVLPAAGLDLLALEEG
jgi:hypothetical protein